MDLKAFSNRMLVIARNVPLEANRIKKQVAKAVNAAVVNGTPVDTGKARSNWIATLGGPADIVIMPYFPTSHGGIGETANASAAIEHAELVIDGVVPGQTINFTNSVDYIMLLNTGWSDQAPAMFVEQAVDVGVATIRNASVNITSERITP
jgi:hypothetical protein